MRERWVRARPLARRLARRGLRVVGVTALVLVGFAVVARYTDLIDRHFVFFPDRTVLTDPGERGLAFEEARFTAADGVRLHGWFVPGRDDKTLVWFHGNAGNISGRLQNLEEMHRYLGVNVLVFDYRGYGLSEGSVSEEGTYLDAEAALDYLRSRDDVDEDRIVLFGRSLGGAVAVEMATKHDFYALVLESTFSSIQAMARHHFPFLPGVGRLVKTRYDTLAKIENVRAPLMVLHGDRDGTAPIEMGREIYEAANSPKRFYAIAGADHNDTYIVGGRPYYDAIAAFLEEPSGAGGE
jgi:fermentation-respiration switch protein FrsA (DUF1100 family)